MNKKAKRKKLFRILFVLYVSILLCAAAVVLYQLYGRLREYQREVDADEYAEKVDRAPQLAFEEYRAGLTAEVLTELWFQDHPESFDEPDRVEEYWGQRLQASKAYRDAEYTSEAPVFVLADEEGVFASFSMSGEELDWTVRELELTEQRFSSCVFETLDGNEVYCGGKQLTQEHVVQREICFEEADYADKLTDPIEKVTYEIEVLVPDPVFEVRNTTPYDMQRLSDGQLRYTLKAEEGQAMQEYAGQLVQALLDFYLFGAENIGANMSAALSYVAKDSVAYDIIKKSYNSVIWRTVIRNAQTELSSSPVTVWAANCVSIDISYHTVKSDEVIADGIYRIFFYDFGNGYQIYDFALI